MEMKRTVLSPPYTLCLSLPSLLSPHTLRALPPYVPVVEECSLRFSLFLSNRLSAPQEADTSHSLLTTQVRQEEDPQEASSQALLL